MNDFEEKTYDNKKSVYDFAVSNELLETSIVRKIIPPQKPYIILPNNFTSDKSIDHLIQLIKNLFNNFFESYIDYEFIDRNCVFNGVYINECNYTDFKISIYQNDNDNLIIEFQRLNKISCGFTFNYLYNTVQNYILKNGMISINDIHIPTNNSSHHSEDEYILELLNSIDTMLETDTYMNHIDTIKTMYTLVSNSNIRKHSFDLIYNLSQTLKKNESLLNLFCILCIKELLKEPEFINEIIYLGVINKLMYFVDDGPYYTAKMRRESSIIIADLSISYSERIKINVSHEEMEIWLNRIDKIEDKKIKENALLAKEYLK